MEIVDKLKTVLFIGSSVETHYLSRGNPTAMPRKIKGIIFRNDWDLRKKVLMVFTQTCFGKRIQRLKYFVVNIIAS